MSDTKPFAETDTAHLQALLGGLPAGLLTFDGALRVRFGNTRLDRLLALPPAARVRRTGVLDLLEASAVLDEAAVAQVHAACLAVVAERDATRTLVVSVPSPRREFAVEICRIEGDFWLATIEEVTGRRAAAARALEEALHDPLTGLPNRQLFFERIAAELAGDGRARPRPGGLSVMMVDLDRFKAVNDTLGHAVGDALLRVVGQRLRTLLRIGDMVARLGGDEFGVLLAPLDAVALARLGARVVDMLGRPYLIEGHLVNIGASVGIASAPADGCDGPTLLKHADLALYHVKSSGRNSCASFEPGMDERANARRTLEIDLRRAAALNQFELHYQPQIDLATNTVTGFEALLRWRHPARGMVSPAEFVPIAEEIGLIVTLGEWVLREACREATNWPDGVSVAVNVSPRQFENGRLADTVAHVLAATGLAGRRLEIEITESVLMRDKTAVLATLRQLRALGARIAMDDFGTGYSSLSQLRAFPFDKIKIDQSFVRGTGTDGDGAIIRAIAAMGASLGMATIAEGVETPAQLSRIRMEGCGSVQGYLFSRPIPACDIAALIADIATQTTRPIPDPAP